MDSQPQNPECRNNPENFHTMKLFLFGLWVNIPVNSYGHIETVS